MRADRKNKRSPLLAAKDAPERITGSKLQPRFLRPIEMTGKNMPTTGKDQMM